MENNTTLAGNSSNIPYMNVGSANKKLTREEIFNMTKAKDEMNISYKDFIKLVSDHQIRSREKYLRNFVKLFRKYDTDSDGILNESEFVNLYLKELLTTLETSISLGNIECMKILKQMRQKYINASDNSIYKSLNDKNKFIYEIAGEMIETDVEINNPAAKLMKIMNYRDFVMPLMRSII